MTVVAWLLFSTVLVEGPVTGCWSIGVERPVLSRRPESAKPKHNQLHYRLSIFNFFMHCSNNMSMLKSRHSVMTNLKSTTSYTTALSNHLLKHVYNITACRHILLTSSFILNLPHNTQNMLLRKYCWVNQETSILLWNCSIYYNIPVCFSVLRSNNRPLQVAVHRLRRPTLHTRSNNV